MTSRVTRITRHHETVSSLERQMMIAAYSQKPRASIGLTVCVVADGEYPWEGRVAWQQGDRLGISRDGLSTGLTLVDRCSVTVLPFALQPINL
jgi:hypothetical protein